MGGGERGLLFLVSGREEVRVGGACVRCDEVERRWGVGHGWLAGWFDCSVCATLVKGSESWGKSQVEWRGLS